MVLVMFATHAMRQLVWFVVGSDGGSIPVILSVMAFNKWAFVNNTWTGN